MKFKVFVDGQHGTTGLKIHELLEKRDEIELLEIDEKDKKNIEKRKELLNSADLVFLCLPDDAAIESVSLIENENVKVIDASTAHRTNPSWVYGIPELTSKQRDKIKNSKRVCVPGCHASGLIISMKPLFRNKILGKNHKLICHSITGYSGGGSSMINDYENGDFEIFGAQRPYALGLNHKHLPEMKYILKTNKAPIFTPSVGNFKQGMLRQLQSEFNCTLCVWTANVNEELVRTTWAQLALKIDYYNESPLKLFNTAKPYFNILLDDRAGLDSAFKTLTELFIYLLKKKATNGTNS
jgi:N-acetyl-gamma-glutamyl-phosphate reductase